MGSLLVAEMLYRTNLVAMVAGGRKPKFADNTVGVKKEILSDFILFCLSFLGYIQCNCVMPKAQTESEMSKNVCSLLLLDNFHINSAPR